MGLPRIKISSIWRVAILLGLSALLYGCPSYTANIKDGSFDVSLPKLFWGSGTYIYPDELYIRGSLSYSIEDKESLPLKDVEEDESKKLQGDQDIRYVLQNNPFSGSVDIFFKKWPLFLGGRLAAELGSSGLVPSLLVFYGINGIYGEFGLGTRLGYSKDNAKYSGTYVHEPCSIDGCWDEEKGDFEEEHFYKNVNIGVYAFSSLFVMETLSLNFSTGLYQPWLFRSSVYLENVPSPYDYDITIDFPFLFSQYVGATYTLLNHIQFSAGEIVYYTLHSDKLHWQTTFSMSYLF